VARDIKYKLAGYDGGLESYPVPESAGQLWLVGSWWELHFKHGHRVRIANGELTDEVLEALPIDNRSCLVSIRELKNREILCSFVLPNTSADRFASDLDDRLGEIADGMAEPEYAEPEYAADDRDQGFPVRLRAVLGQQLRLRGTGPKPYRLYELAATGDERLALLSLLYGDALAQMSCNEGTWFLKRARKYGWELVIESSEGRHVGRYSGHHWLSGGTIFLANNAQVDLRGSYRGWKLEVRDTGERILDIRGRRPPSTLTVRSQPVEIYSEAALAILTTCAVLLLDYWSSQGVAAGGGG
jgi:hypothetical protein